MQCRSAALVVSARHPPPFVISAFAGMTQKEKTAQDKSAYLNEADELKQNGPGPSPAPRRGKWISVRKYLLHNRALSFSLLAMISYVFNRFSKLLRRA